MTTPTAPPRRDFQDARRVCDTLQHPAASGEFRRASIANACSAMFLREYAAGPHAQSGRSLQSRNQVRRLSRLHAAAGRRLDRHGPLCTDPSQRSAGPQLLKAADTAKDQSYFLHGVHAAALAKTLFPLGELRKAEVRKLAHAAGLPVFDKPDSTGICFIGERPFQEFLSRHLRTEPGTDRDDAEGRVLGEHRGLALYTLGQRSGLGIGGRAGAAAAPWYVADKNHRTQRADRRPGSGPSAAVVRCLRRGANALARMLRDAPAQPLECAVKTRYRQSDLRCTLRSGGRAIRCAVRARAARRARSLPASTPYSTAASVVSAAASLRGASIPSSRRTRERIPYNSHFSVEGS